MKESDLRKAFEKFVAAAHKDSHACANLGNSAQIEAHKELFAAGEELHTLMVKTLHDPLIRDMRGVSG